MTFTDRHIKLLDLDTVKKINTFPYIQKCNRSASSLYLCAVALLPFDRAKPKFD